MFNDTETPYQTIMLDFIQQAGISLTIKREDLNHPQLSGNKYRKLKLNLEEAKRVGHDTLLSFGGAYSNHLAALAAAGEAYNFKTIGVIRGEELKQDLSTNPTLSFCVSKGMLLHFVSREKYRRKEDPFFLKEMHDLFGSHYCIPEGGANELGVIGCSEIVQDADKEYDIICVSVGTGSTLAGISRKIVPHQQLWGYTVVKDSSLANRIRIFAKENNWYLYTGFDFGGFGQITKELIVFINSFYSLTGIPLDPVYTGKMMYGIFDQITRGEIQKGTKLLAIHTGGLQGIAGMNYKLQKKGWPLLD